jgi:hypothetical protein
VMVQLGGAGVPRGRLATRCGSGRARTPGRREQCQDSTHAVETPEKITPP